MRYAVIGTGAIGGLFGGMLARNGYEVHFLFHSDYNDVKKNGFTINSKLGNFTLKDIKAYNTTDAMPQCDVVLVSTKTVCEDEVPNMIKPILKLDSTVVLVQNGINMERFVAGKLPYSVSIAGGIVFATATKTAPAEITHTNSGAIKVGLYRGKDDKLTEFCNDVNSTGLKAELTNDLNTERWKKLVCNVPMNGLSAVMGANTKEIVTNAESRRLAYNIMLEVIDTAIANGAKLTRAYADEVMSITENMEPCMPSMYGDLIHHKPMEIQYIYTEVVKSAKAKSVSVPNIETLKKNLLSAVTLM